MTFFVAIFGGAWRYYLHANLHVISTSTKKLLRGVSVEVHRPPLNLHARPNSNEITQHHASQDLWRKRGGTQTST